MKKMKKKQVKPHQTQQGPQTLKLFHEENTKMSDK